MAYISQDTKKKIAAKLKAVVPQGWKYSLAIRNHSTLVMTITEAPFNLIGAFKASPYFDPKKATNVELNTYHYRSQIEDECIADIFGQIISAMNDGNWDKSDIQSDYFDVGWYIDIRIGRWDKPFKVTGELAVAA